MSYIQIQDFIKANCPNLYKFTALPQTKWDNINLRMDRRLKYLESQIEKYGSVDAETSLFDIIIQSKEELNQVAKDYLNFIESLIKDINNLVPHNFHKKLKKRAYDLIANFDNIRSYYRDPIGEFIALITIIRNSDYQIDSIEYKMPNGKQADFKLNNQKTKILVDVLNINFKDGLIKSADDLNSFLSKRISDKISDKISGLTFNEIKHPFCVLPVIWCDLNEIKNFNHVFERVQQKYSTLPFCSIAQFSDENKKYGFYFSTINNISDKM